LERQWNGRRQCYRWDDFGFRGVHGPDGRSRPGDGHHHSSFRDGFNEVRLGSGDGNTYGGSGFRRQLDDLG
jgi:hypothetical protein